MNDGIPIAAPASISSLREEVGRLKAEGSGCLAAQGGLEVYLAASGEIPVILEEIGRLREVTFRAVGEGTGRAVDLDDYDYYYLHLFLWDPEAGKIAGGYRIACTDVVMAEHGAGGLVTASCFEFKPEFLDYLNPGLELGRAFIVCEYQKSMYPLSLLWKGIGRFIAQNPQYHQLFGCVSISDDYTHISKDLIVRYMRCSHQDRALARWIRPNHAYEELPDMDQISPLLQSIEEVSAQVAATEPDGKGVPVLLRQYLRLNAILLEFGVDPDFNNSLDALVLVDLKKTPPRTLKRYLGKEGMEAIIG